MASKKIHGPVIDIDFTDLSEEGLHQIMKVKLGFPEYYGMNWDAMFDCLFYLRQPDVGMTSVKLVENESLTIRISNIEKSLFSPGIFLRIVDDVNRETSSKWRDFNTIITITTPKIRVSKGNVFEVRLCNGKRMYFQYICNDLDALNSDVVRIFKSQYDKRPDSLDEILSDEVAMYSHTTVTWGVENGYWTRIGSCPYDASQLNVKFISSKMEGLNGKPFWNTWKLNNSGVCSIIRHRVHPINAKKYYLGGVFPPRWLYELIDTGEYQIHPKLKDGICSIR